MSRFPNQALAAFTVAAVVGLASAGTAAAEKFGLGREALPEEVAAWDIDVRPDGQGLPEGSGTVAEGEQIFAERCASCHGDFGEGRGRWPVLAGGQDSLKSQDPVKTVGSYWPYLSTVYDYVHRAMPYGNAQSLSADETYAVVAYILDLNFLMEEDTLSKENFTDITMPNEDGFFDDDRPDVPTMKDGEPCMTDCKDTVEVVMRARVLDVTPEGEKHTTNEIVEDMTVGDPVGVSEEQAADDSAEADGEMETAAIDTDLADKGEKVFRRCKSCHAVEPGKHRVGPSLHGVFGSESASAEGFTKYSGAMEELGVVWDAETLDKFLENPRGFVKGTRMAFGGLRKEEDRAALVEYLKTLSSSDGS